MWLSDYTVKLYGRKSNGFEYVSLARMYGCNIDK